MKIKYMIFGVTIALTSASVVTATEFRASSVRALGMGGSNVASTSGVDATYWNPAAYGFFGEKSPMDNSGMADKDYGFDIGVGVGANIFGPMADNLTTLQNMQQPTGNTATGLSGQEIVNMATFVNDFESLDPALAGFNVNADATVGARVFNYGVGVRSSADVNVGVLFDNQNVGLGANFISAMTANPTVIPGGNPATYYTPAEEAALATSLVSATITQAQADNIAANYNNALTVQSDPQLAQAAGVTYDPTLIGNQAAMSASLVTLATAPGDIQTNNTTVATRGVLATEVGVTYGYAMNDNLSVGGVIKYIQADIVNQTVVAFGSTDTTSNVIDFAAPETSTGYGLDMGVMYRLPELQAGLTVRNINSPSFEHSSGYVYEMKPQAKAGVAWMPMDTLTLEAGFDLTENEGATADSKSQYWNVGVEWDAFHVLALRIGAFENTAGDIGLVPTVGLGVNMWAARLDIAAAVSTKTEVLEGSETPVFGMVSAALAVDF